MNPDEKYMKMALTLARRGLGSVEPNPAVGAVIVKDGDVIGRGWHKKFGELHAEINALEDCRKRGISPEGATMYVTLEPCCHRGKTGPCTDAIIDARLAGVVAATIDPSLQLKGKGVEQLRWAAIKVDVGICENDAKLLNAPFMKFAKTGNCWVTLKWAQTIDGKLAWANQTDERRWISGQESRKDAHKLRRRAGAILVGVNTVLADDPLLTPRPSGGKKPLRIVLDNKLRILLDCQLLATAKNVPVIICASDQAVNANLQKVEQIKDNGAEILAYPQSEQSNLNLLLDELSRRGVQRLLVEGGPTVIGSFLKEDLADEVVVYISPKILGRQGSDDISQSAAQLAKGTGLHCVDVKRLGDDVRITGLTQKALQEASIPGSET